MCGILGWLGAHNPEDVERFGSALDLLKHRGPDDRGIYQKPGLLLGHRRLSILDLSPGGHQPMLHEETDAAIVFNGEIYNHVELRQQLENLGHRFKGNSDTEVLLHALIAWGEDAIPRLNGMWAFAFWHPARNTLLLARDRFGVKPLYFREGRDGFAFASEPKSLLALFAEHRSVNITTLLDFLGNNLLYAKGDSFYDGIKVFPPAHFAEYNLDSCKLKLTRYWDYPVDSDKELTAEKASDEFENLFSDSVRLRLRSDVPVGLTLSGGLDSTGVLAASALHNPEPLTCFTSVYDDGNSDELVWAKLAAQTAGAPLTPVTASQDDWLDTLRKIAWHMDGPGYSPAVIPLWHLMKRARADGVPVLLEGQGADEALAGYPQYAVLEFLSYLSGKTDQPFSLKGLGNRFQSLRRTFTLRWTLAWMARELSPLLLDLHRRRVGFKSLLRNEIKIPSVPVLNKASKADLVRNRLLEDHSRTILPGLLHYGDAVSMSHSIEARNPFLDYRLVEWMFRLPNKLIFNQNQTKWVLRQFLVNHGQESIGNRPDKKGYPTPIGNWLASEQGSEVEQLLLESDGVLGDLCNSATSYMYPETWS